MIVGIIGLGIVGKAIYKDLLNKNINLKIYDKYKNKGIGSIEDTLVCDIIFLCLPTPYEYSKTTYNKDSIYDVCNYYSLHNFKGLLVLKSTVEPEITENLSNKYNINIIHNPEFLTASSAYNDVKNQNHIVIGITKKVKIELKNKLIKFYNTYYPNATISILSSTESELMKLGVNTFYSVKIQYFNELYSLSQKLNISFNKVKDAMLKNNWINPMHTLVPGTDGELSYGGMCFPKDTNALNQFMIKKNSDNLILNSTIEERNKMRIDNINII